jgi:hypothetical protein
LRNIQVVADLSHQVLLDLAVSRHGGKKAIRYVFVNRMPRTLSRKDATMRFEPAN